MQEVVAMKPRQVSLALFYCRHDNRVVGACPRIENIGQCPLRLDCPAFASGCRSQFSLGSPR